MRRRQRNDAGGYDRNVRGRKPIDRDRNAGRARNVSDVIVSIDAESARHRWD
jgi:hypothetical protein